MLFIQNKRKDIWKNGNNLQSFADEFVEVIESLRSLNITIADITKAGGNKSPIPPKFNDVLDLSGWKEIKISGDLLIKFYPRKGERKGVLSDTVESEKVIHNYIDGHNIDFVKGRVALDVEWNSKDQTYDRDLFAMHTYYECDIISAGIIITRSESLNEVFKELGVISKYGAITTFVCGEYKTNLVWEKIRKDGGTDGRGVGFYLRNVTELLLFGIKGTDNRTLQPGRSQMNLLRSMKREHSRKPDEFISRIEACSPGPYLEMFARGNRSGWTLWGNQATEEYEPDWATYANHTIAKSAGK